MFSIGAQPYEILAFLKEMDAPQVAIIAASIFGAPQGRPVEFCNSGGSCFPLEHNPLKFKHFLRR